MSRVLHLISSNQRRGAEVFGVELAAELRSRGHEVNVLAVGPSTVGPWLDVDVAGASRRDPRGFARTVHAARHAEVVVSFGSVSLQNAALACAVARRPFVYRNIGDPAAWHNVRLRWLRVGVPLRRASAIVAVFPAAGDCISGMYGVPTSAIRVIPRGVDPTRFTPVSAAERLAARHSLGLDPERPWLAFIGSLSEEKDPMLALDVAERLDSVGLVIAGDGPLLDAVRGRGEGMGGRVRVLGPVDDVRTVLAAADALLLTSRTEGVPGVLIEAALTGLPAIASEVGGVPSALVDGETGVLAAHGDLDGFVSGAEAVIAQSGAMGESARDLCSQRFSLSIVGDAWESLIGDVINRRLHRSAAH